MRREEDPTNMQGPENEAEENKANSKLKTSPARFALNDSGI